MVGRMKMCFVFVDELVTLCTSTGRCSENENVLSLLIKFFVGTVK